jgi:predicted nucleic acid-binding protein
VQPVILDTDVASLLHRRRLTGPLATRLIGREPLITFVTLGELTKWAEIRRWGPHRRQELTDWLSAIPVLPGDEAVATTWGRLSAEVTLRGRPRPVNDMRIAACCLTYEVPLVTLNLKDYEDFTDVRAAAAPGKRLSGNRDHVTCVARHARLPNAIPKDVRTKLMRARRSARFISVSLYSRAV